MKVLNKRFLFLVFLFLTVSVARAQWVRSAKSQAFSRSNAVAADALGNVFTAGIFSCITAFDGDSLLNNSCGEVAPPAPVNPQVDAFLSKRDENGNLLWVSHFQGSSGNKLFINDIGLDNTGNCYITGAYTGALDLSVVQFSNPDATTEFFLAKIRPDGTTEWAVSYPVDALSETSAQKIAVTQNAVYITGMVRDDFQIGALSDSVGRDASFVASFDLAGTALWVKHFMEINVNGSSRGKAIEAKGDSIWVFSSFTDSVRINGTIYRPPGTVPTVTAGVICLYDAAGNQLNQLLTNTPFIEGMRLHRPDASLYITGRAENITAIGEDTLFSTAGVRAYVSSHSLDMDAPTTLQWVTPLTAPATTALTGIDLDVNIDGSILAAGTFHAVSLNGPTTSVTGGGGQNGFLLKLDNTGDDLWLQAFGGAGEDALSGVSSPDDTRIFAAGYFSQYIRVAGDEIFSASASNGLTARIDICPQLIAEMITADSTFICKRNTALFQVTDNALYTYLWYKDGSPLAGSDNADLEVTDAGVYRVEITGAGCTKFTPVAKLFINPLPDSVVLTNDPLENCEGEVVALTGPIGTYTFQWLDGGLPIAETAKDISIQTNGDYQVQITDTLGCTILSDTFLIRFSPYPLNTLTPSGGTYKLCSGNSLMLQADNSQPGLTWQWKKDDLPLVDEILSAYEVTESGIYHAVISNATGCETITEADTVIVQSSPVVDLNDESLPGEICEGASLRLVTQQVIGQTYQWLADGTIIPGANSNRLDIGTAGEYRVRVNNALCEKLSDPFNLVVNPLPVAAITNDAGMAICEGDVYALEAVEASAYSYQWFNNNQLISGEIQSALQIVNTGNYTLQVTNEFNCQHTSPVTSIVVNLKPPASITPQGPTTFCEGEAVDLLANAGTLFAWQWVKDGAILNGSIQQTIQVTDGGLYEVRVTNSNQCTRTSDPVQVQVVPIPVATIASAAGLTAICERDSLQLMGGSSASFDFTWFYNDQLINQSASSVHYAKMPGNYWVVAAVGNCRDTSSVLNLQVRPNPLPTITRNEVFLSIALFGDIQWYRNNEVIPGATLQAIRTEADGDYRVNVVNTEGCSAWSGIVPVCLPIPEIQKKNDVLTVSIAASQYAWEYKDIPINGASLRQLTAQQSGSYTVVVVSEDGCVMETQAMTVCVPYPFITRDDFSGVLYAFPNPASGYQWYFEGSPVPGATTQVHIPDDAGVYSVEVHDLEGCVSSSESFSITPVTGSEEALSQMVRMYPNPVKNLLTIENPGRKRKIFMTMVDAAGRTIHKNEIVQEVQLIDLSSLPKGAYTIIIRGGNQSASWKLVKE